MIFNFFRLIPTTFNCHGHSGFRRFTTTGLNSTAKRAMAKCLECTTKRVMADNLRPYDWLVKLPLLSFYGDDLEFGSFGTKRIR